MNAIHPGAARRLQTKNNDGALPTEAKAAFESFLKDSPPDAPWRQMLVAEMQDMTARPPALDQQTMANASNMSASDQQAMIRSMVDGLEQKLAANPDNLDGWLRLIRVREIARNSCAQVA